MSRFRNWPDWALVPLAWLQIVFDWLGINNTVMGAYVEYRARRQDELKLWNALDPTELARSKRLETWYETTDGRRFEATNVAMEAFLSVQQDIAQWCADRPDVRLRTGDLDLVIVCGDRQLVFVSNAHAGLAFEMVIGGALHLERRLYPRCHSCDGSLYYSQGDTRRALMDCLTWLSGADDAPCAP